MTTYLARRRVAACVALLFVGLLQAGAAVAVPPVMPLDSRVNGVSYGEWAAKFWQWAMSMPIDHHPLYDTADVSEGQLGNVWFLGASFSPSVTGGGQVLAYAHRTGTIPAGIFLFFPILNAEASTIEGNGTTDAELRAAAQGFQDLAANMTCTIDGEAVPNLDGYRVQSPLYTFGPLPDNNIPQSFGLDAPAGTTSLSVADGVHLLLSPLSAGQHTIHFTGEVPAFNFFVDITYDLNVLGARRGRGSISGSGSNDNVSVQAVTWTALKGLYAR